MTTPQNPYQTPPQGGQVPQNPYGAPNGGVPPQGYPGQSVPNQGVPPQGYPAPPAVGYAAPPAPPQASGRAGRFGRNLVIRLVVAIVGVIVLGVGYTIYDHATGGADTAKVGDCVQNSGTDSNPDVHVINCSDPNAKFKVVAVLDGTDMNQCNGRPDVTAAYSQSGGRYSNDVVLCLGDNK